MICQICQTFPIKLPTIWYTSDLPATVGLPRPMVVPTMTLQNKVQLCINLAM